ncbi:hypothetical protein [Nocardiopsis protaetiae]|uniref:hypothetical protein n=1 Tax=Nocardiopsis protaetiae TaxID=3382270 RepID=UPI00387B1F6F
MAHKIGAIRMDGLLTCAHENCDWSEWVDLSVSSPVGRLTMHRIEAHFDEYARQHPESAAILLENDNPKEP